MEAKIPSEIRRLMALVMFGGAVAVSILGYLQAAGKYADAADKETAIRAMLNSASHAVVIVDRNHSVIEWNTGAEALFGWAREEMIGQPVTMVMPEDCRAAHNRAFNSAMERGTQADETVVARCEALTRTGEKVRVRITLRMYTVGGEHFAYDGIDREGTVRFVDARPKEAKP